MEKFGHIKVDKQPELVGWEGVVPYLDSWKVVYGHQPLNTEQKRFLEFVIDSLDKGIMLDRHVIHPYLSLAQSELKKKSKGIPSQLTINRIKTLRNLYGFLDYDLQCALERVADRLRNQRVASLRKEPLAKWVRLGESVMYGERKLIRGYFYFGSHVKFSRYNSSSNAFFMSTTDIEGPVINPTPFKEGLTDGELKDEYTTFVEMPETLKEELLSWLAGEGAPNFRVLQYYLAGIQFKLLADKETTNEERAEILKYLVDCYNDPSFDVKGQKSTIKQYIFGIISSTAARYFTENAEDILPKSLTDDMIFLKRARVFKELEKRGGKIIEDDEIVKIAKEKVTPMAWLPEVYHNAFAEKLGQYVKEELTHRSEAIYDNRFCIKPVADDKCYVPLETVKQALTAEPYRPAQINVRTGDKVMIAFAALCRTLSRAEHLHNNGASPMAIAKALPTWLDPSLMPGAEESMAKLLPAHGEDIRMIKLSEILQLLGAKSAGDSLTEDEAEILSNMLYNLGLRMGVQVIGKVKLSLNETVSLYSKSYGEIPRRGTMILNVFLAAWILGADSYTENDMHIVEQWLRENTESGKSPIPAIATLRWMSGRKMVMTKKRKLKAATLKSYTKRRDAIIRLLLSLVAETQTISPKRMKRLETVYELVGLDPASIHSDIHRMATTVQGPKSIAAKSSKTSSIDKAKLKAMTESTQKAQQILSQVFEDEKEEIAIKPTESTGNPTIEIIKLLVDNEEWSREDFEALSKKFGETAGSMLERLNDYAYDTIDEAVVEDEGDVIYVDTDIAQQLIDK